VAITIAMGQRVHCRQTPVDKRNFAFDALTRAAVSTRVRTKVKDL
jgi:hypothetical protein